MFRLIRFCSTLFLLVLPKKVKHRLVNELDKRLDLDIDAIFQSPKLRLQLSPAELDKRLLELYKNVADGPRGDVLRIIGGGNDVALQDLYVRRKKNRQSLLGPSIGDNAEEKDRTTSQWVNSVLKRNLPKTGGGPLRRGDDNDKDNKSDELKMCLTSRHSRTFAHVSSCQTAFTRKFHPGRSRASSFSLLI